MQVDPLIPMINRIGAFFQTQPNHTEAVQAIADHVRLFWEPRMRSSIFDYLSSHPKGKSSEYELLPIVVEALHTYREQLEPKR